MAIQDWLNTLVASGRFNKELSDAMAKTLLDQEHVASGRLYQSIKADTYSKNKAITSVIKGLARGEDLDKTRYNVLLSIPQILNWMTKKNRSVYAPVKFYGKDSRDPKRRRIAYAIQKQLKTDGTVLSFNGKPKTGWISKNWDRHRINIDTRIAPHVLKDVVENINNILREFAAKNPNVKFFG